MRKSRQSEYLSALKSLVLPNEIYCHSLWVLGHSFPDSFRLKPSIQVSELAVRSSRTMPQGQCLSIFKSFQSEFLSIKHRHKKSKPSRELKLDVTQKYVVLFVFWRSKIVTNYSRFQAYCWWLFRYWRKACYLIWWATHQVNSVTSRGDISKL